MLLSPCREYGSFARLRKALRILRRMKFRAKLQLEGKTATGIRVPEEVVTGLAAGKRVAVTVTIKGYTYRSTIAPYNGVYMLPVSAEVRDGAGVKAGDMLDIELAVDSAPREVAVPADLAAALAQNAKARAYFQGLSYSHKKAYVLWIEEAKKAETRQKRVAGAVEMLNAGKTR
jgi:hypothetical protein